MTDGEAVWLWAYSVVLLVWVVRLLVLNWVRGQLLFLSPSSLPKGGAGDLSTVSILVPAKDEEKSIGFCLQSLLELDYPHLEILVVDDRSSDRTAAVVQEYVRLDSRLRLLSIRELPPGWTGKTHALHQGVQHVTGDWLLFVDADTRHHTSNLRVLLAFAEQEQADLVSLLPGLSCQSWWEKLIQPLAAIMLMLFFRLPRVNSERYPKTAFANGQYILIRRRAYELVGGHATVRNQFVEDIHLARQVKGAGLRLRVALAPELTTTRMYSSWSEIRAGWSRIFYAAVDHRPWKLLLQLVMMFVFSLSAYVSLGVTLFLLLRGDPSTATWILAGMTGLHLTMMFWALAMLYGFTRCPRRYLWGHLLACLAMVVILLRAIGLCFTHRLAWRGTTYGPEMRRPT